MKKQSNNQCSLYIIGNGFDLSHNLPTKYSDFREYLVNTSHYSPRGFLSVPDVTIGHHGDVIVNEEGSARLFIEWLDWSLGETWSDLEDALGQLDYDSVFSDISQELDDDHPFNGFYDAEDLAESIKVSVSRVIDDWLLEWIRGIDIQNVKQKYQLDPYGLLSF